MIHFEIRHPDVEGAIGEIKLHPESVRLLFEDIKAYMDKEDYSLDDHIEKMDKILVDGIVAKLTKGNRP